MKHPELVRRLCKPGSEICQHMTGHRAHLLHMVVGIAGEAGELLDAVKKFVVYDQDLDIDNIIEELGDLEFYVLTQNITKLSLRYPDLVFSNNDAATRADKETEDVDDSQ